MEQNDKIEKAKRAAEVFQKEVEAQGLKFFLYVEFSEELTGVWNCNFLHDDNSSFHYLKNSVDVCHSLKIEVERWKNVVVGTQLTFRVVCVNDTMAEPFIKKGVEYTVISVLHAVGGYGFILCDLNGKHVDTPPGTSSFHSSRFDLSKSFTLSN